MIWILLNTITGSAGLNKLIDNEDVNSVNSANSAGSGIN